MGMTTLLQSSHSHVEIALWYILSKQILHLCSQVYPELGGRRQREVQPDCVVLGGGAWQLHPQPRRLSLFHEGAVRHPEGDLVWMARWVSGRDATHAADWKWTILYWWGHLHQWWAWLRWGYSWANSIFHHIMIVQWYSWANSILCDPRDLPQACIYTMLNTSVVSMGSSWDKVYTESEIWVTICKVMCRLLLVVDVLLVVNVPLAELGIAIEAPYCWPLNWLPNEVPRWLHHHNNSIDRDVNRHLLLGLQLVQDIPTSGVSENKRSIPGTVFNLSKWFH